MMIIIAVAMDNAEMIMENKKDTCIKHLEKYIFCRNLYSTLTENRTERVTVYLGVNGCKEVMYTKIFMS